MNEIRIRGRTVARVREARLRVSRGTAPPPLLPVERGNPTLPSTYAFSFKKKGDKDKGKTQLDAPAKRPRETRRRPPATNPASTSNKGAGGGRRETTDAVFDFCRADTWWWGQPRTEIRLLLVEGLAQPGTDELAQLETAVNDWPGGPNVVAIRWTLWPDVPTRELLKARGWRPGIPAKLATTCATPGAETCTCPRGSP